MKKFFALFLALVAFSTMVSPVFACGGDDMGEGKAVVVADKSE